MNNSEYWLWYRGFLHYLGKAVSQAQREAGYRLWDNANRNDRTCSLCGKFVKFRDRSIDHIVPKSICWELGLYKLVIDERNFRIMHSLCNARRSSDTSDLPQEILAKLKEIAYTRDN